MSDRGFCRSRGLLARVRYCFGDTLIKWRIEKEDRLSLKDLHLCLIQKTESC